MAQLEASLSDSLSADTPALGSAAAAQKGNASAGYVVNSSSGFLDTVADISGSRTQSQHLLDIFEALESRIDADPDGFVNDLDCRMRSLLNEAALAPSLESVQQSLSEVACQDVPAEDRAHLDAQLQSVSEVCEALKSGSGQGGELSEEECIRAQGMLLGMLDQGPLPHQVLAQLAPEGSEDDQFAKLVHCASTSSDLTKAAASLGWDDIQMSSEDASRIFQEMMDEIQWKPLE